ncbi:complexed with cef1p [Exophiala bonariae]|uniref:Complexed with cef1p n=1 Tax=Exophiala bonariae TaxID=1690606 RepID=A0AAV9MRP8_9EURO|nr:complexed with cef1p [Exophiala bonariae]
MTTAHRPTFDPARGKEAQRGVAYHQRLLPAYTLLKVRQPGQGGAADTEPVDLRAQLLAAEAAHFAKTKGTPVDTATSPPKPAKRELEASLSDDENENEDPDAKRRRVLEETRDIDADSEDDDEDSDSSEEDDEEEDETAALMQELEKIKRERAEQKAREEAEQSKQAQEQREEDIALGNPLLNPKAFNVKRRWDDDVVFKNQARGTEQKGNQEFVNDLLRSDFHKKFMSKYVR